MTLLETFFSKLDNNGLLKIYIYLYTLNFKMLDFASKTVIIASKMKMACI